MRRELDEACVDDGTKRKVVVNDRMQHGYVYYRTEPVGRNFEPGLAPQLMPQQMLRLGVFGGTYITDCRDEFPASWFAHAKLCPDRHDPRLNYFGVNASQSLAEWRRKGWIHPQDPRGWFQWYPSRRHSQLDEISVSRRWTLSGLTQFRLGALHRRAKALNAKKFEKRCRTESTCAIICGGTARKLLILKTERCPSG